MTLSSLLLCICLFAIAAFAMGRTRVLRRDTYASLNALPHYYGILASIWVLLPALLVIGIWLVFNEPLIERIVLNSMPPDVLAMPEAEQGLFLSQVYSLAYDLRGRVAPDFMLQAAELLRSLEQKSRWLRSSLVLLSMLVAMGAIWLFIKPKLRARDKIEGIFKRFLMLCSLIAILTTVGIVLSVLFESLRFFSIVPIQEFLFGLQWSPQGSFDNERGSFGAVPLFAGTLMIAGIAMFIAVPVGLMSAIFLSEYAPARLRAWVKPTIEILAGVPTVVYGFFAAITVAPRVRDIASWLGLEQWLTISSESALAAGVVMGVMIIPLISSLADDVLRAVPNSLRDGALGLGATHSEMVKQVVMPAALPGIIGGVMLAVSRAIGETMIVVMAAGLAANLSLNPLDTVTTVTVQIVTLLVGDQTFDSPKTLAAFALGLMLFLTTLLLNYFALYVVRRYREHYE